MRTVIIFTLSIGVFTAHATEFVPDELIAEDPGSAVYEYDGRYGDRTGAYDPLEVFADAAQFISTLQVLDPGDDFGGIREG